MNSTRAYDPRYNAKLYVPKLTEEQRRARAAPVESLRRPQPQASDAVAVAAPPAAEAVPAPAAACDSRVDASAPVRAGKDPAPFGDSVRDRWAFHSRHGLGGSGLGFVPGTSPSSRSHRPRQGKPRVPPQSCNARLGALRADSPRTIEAPARAWLTCGHAFLGIPPE